ncbi:hypothetical protein C8R46DRAFT_1150679 [Mycena filopes]|nr:hypothetical protein C8R46DRAFT_1150679 [Mycena filopes]
MRRRVGAITDSCSNCLVLSTLLYPRTSPASSSCNLTSRRRNVSAHRRPIIASIIESVISGSSPKLNISWSVLARILRDLGASSSLKRPPRATCANRPAGGEMCRRGFWCILFARTSPTCNLCDLTSRSRNASAHWRHHGLFLRTFNSFDAPDRPTSSIPSPTIWYSILLFGNTEHAAGNPTFTTPRSSVPSKLISV